MGIIKMKFTHPIVMALYATVSIDLSGVEEFVAGVVEGFVNKNDLNEIKACLTDADTLEPEIEAIVKDLQSLDVAHIVDAVKKIVTLVQQIPGDLKTCEAIQGDITKITNWASSIDPTKIPGNVINNLSPTVKDVQTITTDFQSNNYMDAGEQVADIAIEVLGPVPSKNTGLIY